MYKVIKEKGNNSNIALKNTDTNGEVNLGRLSMEIIHILEGQGYTFGSEDKDVKYKDEWSLEVDEDAKAELAKLAMPMKKPIRDQRKKPVEKKPNKEIDAMDVLLGLASYN